MRPLYIEGTDDSPTVKLDPVNNIFEFTGKSMPEDVRSFYIPILEWLFEYCKKPNPETIVNFNVEYFNSASSKHILEIIKSFEMILESGNNVLVRWHYLHDDEDMEESGVTYASISETPIELVSY